MIGEADQDLEVETGMKVDIIFKFRSQGNFVTSPLLNGLEIVEQMDNQVTLSISEAALTHLLEALRSERGFFAGQIPSIAFLSVSVRRKNPARGLM